MLWGTVESLELLLPELPFTGVREGLEVRNTPTQNHFLPPAEALFNLLSIFESQGEFPGHLLCAKAAL